MVLRETLDPDTNMWHWIAADLHFWRTRHKMSCAELGRHLKRNRQGVSNMEADRPGFRMTERDAQILDELWNLNGHFQRLIRYARLGHNPDWFREHVTYEAKADILKIFELSFIPGLLQTENYARALYAATGLPDVETQVAARMARQTILSKDEPPLLWVLLDEIVVRRVLGSREAMKEQLAWLLELSGFRNISVRVVPLSVGYHDGLVGSFKVMTVGREDVAYFEAQAGGRVSLAGTDTSEFSVKFARIGDEAISASASRNLIRSVMEDL